MLVYFLSVSKVKPCSLSFIYMSVLYNERCIFSLHVHTCACTRTHSRTHLCVVLRLGMSGAVSPLSICLYGVQRDNFTFTFTTHKPKIFFFKRTRG
jgi:hypothetical protein